jgi:hypothetical protein
VQAGKRQVRFRLHSRRHEDRHPAVPREPARLGQQAGLADASLTSHDQHPAASVRANDQFFENANLALPPYQGRRLHTDIVLGSEEAVQVGKGRLITAVTYASPT